MLRVLRIPMKGSLYRREGDEVKTCTDPTVLPSSLLWAGEVYASLQLEPRGVDETAFIMYSSGSTASPKGALTSFGNMHHQFEMIALSLDAREQPVNCWWAPHFHDFGLLSGFLNTLHQGGHCVVTSPMYFIQRPAIWLDMLHKYSATHTFGPDFGSVSYTHLTLPTKA